MPVKITAFEIENVKKVKAMSVKLLPSGLTIIGGKCGQGKTTNIDAIAWTLGGEKHRPSNPKRDDAIGYPRTKITLDNGITVERKGKTSALTVTDPAGKKAGQTLLNSFISQFALDLPKFLNASTKEKAEILLDVIGVGPQLKTLDTDAQRIFDERHAIGQISTSKKKHAEELPEFSDAPGEPVSVSALIKEQQEILATNAENERKRQEADILVHRHKEKSMALGALQTQLDEAKDGLTNLTEDLDIAQRTAKDLQDKSTAKIEGQIANVEGINAQVGANLQKAQAQAEATDYQAQCDSKTADLEKVRTDRQALLDSADLPLEGLSVLDGELIYKGQKWDCMGGGERLRVGTAIVRAHAPDCGFVLMDRLEQMDLDTLREFNEWLETEGLQVVATRVSTGAECTIIIEDGLPVDAKGAANV